MLRTALKLIGTVALALLLAVALASAAIAVQVLPPDVFGGPWTEEA